MRKSDLEIFIDKYEPIMDDTDIKKFDTYGEDWEEVQKLRGEKCEFLWTMISGDSNKWYLAKGYHLVNRECFIICKKPWDENSRDYLYF